MEREIIYAWAVELAGKLRVALGQNHRVIVEDNGRYPVAIRINRYESFEDGVPLIDVEVEGPNEPKFNVHCVLQTDQGNWNFIDFNLASINVQDQVIQWILSKQHMLKE